MKTLIIIPTYNERDNVKPIVEAVFSQNLGVDVLVVDDNSPDGTAQIVKDMQSQHANLHLLSRAGKAWEERTLQVSSGDLRVAMKHLLKWMLIFLIDRPI